MDKVHVYKCFSYCIDCINWWEKNRVFCSPFPLLLARASLWPKRSGKTTQPLVALLSAVLLKRMKWVAT